MANTFAHNLDDDYGISYKERKRSGSHDDIQAKSLEDSFFYKH